jgi:group I intron endonuclease
MKIFLMDGLRTACGCYLIRNTKTGATYVGKAVSLSDRAADHLKAMKGEARDYAKIPAKMRKDVEIYGVGAFEFRVLCFCDNERLELNEKMLIAALRPEYNTQHVSHVESVTRFSREADDILRWAKGMERATAGRNDPWAQGMRRAIRAKLATLKK